MKNGGILARARYSVAGLGDAWRSERSFRTHLGFSLAVVALLAFLRPDPIWCAIVVLSLAAGMACEAMNGALEALADLVEPRRDPRVRVIKDMASAGAFTINVATAIIVAMMMFSHF